MGGITWLLNSGGGAYEVVPIEGTVTSVSKLAYAPDGSAHFLYGLEQIIEPPSGEVPAGFWPCEGDECYPVYVTQFWHAARAAYPGSGWTFTKVAEMNPLDYYVMNYHHWITGDPCYYVSPPPPDSSESWVIFRIPVAADMDIDDAGNIHFVIAWSSVDYEFVADGSTMDSSCWDGWPAYKRYYRYHYTDLNKFYSCVIELDGTPIYTHRAKEYDWGNTPQGCQMVGVNAKDSVHTVATTRNAEYVNRIIIDGSAATTTGIPGLITMGRDGIIIWHDNAGWHVQGTSQPGTPYGSLPLFVDQGVAGNQLCFYTSVSGHLMFGVDDGGWQQSDLGAGSAYGLTPTPAGSARGLYITSEGAQAGTLPFGNNGPSPLSWGSISAWDEEHIGLLAFVEPEVRYAYGQLSSPVASGSWW
jgi:hypothetical protein